MSFTLPKDLAKWPPENDNGHIEYKAYLDATTSDEKISKMVTQLHWRLMEGLDKTSKHEAIYVIGVYDKGIPAKLTSEQLQASLKVMERVCTVRNTIFKTTVVDAGGGYIAIMYIKDPHSIPRIMYYDSISI